jgi:ADP-ribose pyrophosphatase YjhB (NUDIX family)
MTTWVRAVALAVCRREGHILVERGHDRVRGEHYLRGIGGGVEFGERAADALAREWREEFGLELKVGELLGVVENLFTHEGVAGHEVVFVFAADLADETVYERDEIESVEPGGLRHSALWVRIDELRRGKIPFYPPGLLDLIGDDESPPPRLPHRTWRSGP